MKGMKCGEGGLHVDSHAEQNLPGQDEWVDEVSEVLSQLGVTPESTVDDIKPIVESLGFQIPVLEVDHGGMLSTYVLYHAQLFDPKDHFNSPGYFSRKSLDDALAVALAFGLMARRERPGA